MKKKESPKENNEFNLEEFKHLHEIDLKGLKVYSDEMPEIEEKKSPWRFLKYIIVIVLLAMIFLWYIPIESVKVDPEPKNIPTFKEVLNENISITGITYPINSATDYLKPINPSDPAIKNIANKIASSSCDANRICYAKALYYFVQKNFNYISDPINKEYVENPLDFMLSGGGDCESGTIALASLLESIGINSQIVLTENHAFLRIYLDEVPKGYKQKDNYVYLDWTCKDCRFGQIPFGLENVKGVVG